MNNSLKWLFLIMMASALLFGFLHLLIPAEQYNFERLHIFLFNLCSGGTLILYFSENRDSLSVRGRLFLLLSFCFALSAFFNFSLAAIILPWPLALLTEIVRVKTFGRVIPVALFSAKEDISRKFHQASLLFLSCTLAFSSCVLFNQKFGPWISADGFSLNTFYLAFSFPVSLISLAVIFSQVRKNPSGIVQSLNEISFWGITLGVVIFFLFILGHLYIPQMSTAIVLFLMVLLVFFVHLRCVPRSQQKNFLTSGITFLLATAISGISYIYMKYSGGFTPEQLQPLLRIHTFTSLYGWNLSGLALICRRKEFPIQLNSTRVIALHWFTVIVLCPLGYYFLPVAVAAITAYVIFLFKIFFSNSHPKKESAEQPIRHQAPGT